jgi:hypothetical protein
MAHHRRLDFVADGVEPDFDLTRIVEGRPRYIK